MIIEKIKMGLKMGFDARHEKVVENENRDPGFQTLSSCVGALMYIYLNLESL
jgi:hypothetical protein